MVLHVPLQGRADVPRHERAAEAVLGGTTRVPSVVAGGPAVWALSMAALISNSR